MKKHETNRFTLQVGLSFPGGATAANINQWFNRQWTGEPTVPLDEVIPEDMKAANYSLHACRRVALTIEVGKDGSWKLVEANML